MTYSPPTTQGLDGMADARALAYRPVCAVDLRRKGIRNELDS